MAKAGLRNTEWTGVQELDRVLKKLPPTLNTRVLVSAYKQAGKPTIKRMRELVPVGKTQNLKRSIGSVKAKNFKGLATVRIGPRRGRGKTQKGYHGILVEEGTKPHDIKLKRKKVLYDGNVFYGTGARHPGSKPQPFVEPAINATVHQVKNLVKIEIGNALIKTMRKHL